MAKVKKRLTNDQEFQIMKLVLDKFLWIAMIFMLYGIYQGVVLNLVWEGVAWAIAGFIILIIFMVMLIREYEIIK